MLERIGRYELRGALGKGAAGTVYDAWDTQLDRRVAVKTLHLPVDGDENAAESYARFKREAKTAAGLSHPGIVQVYDSGEVDGIAFIAMELIEGQSLKALLDEELRLAPPEAVRVMRELLDALSYSHAHGVIHRDIKPTNILVTRSGTLKIADFGIARIESSSMTQLGTVMGTPAYMSPEQFMGQSVDQRTDVYAAGVLLYHLLTGEKPFEGGLTAIMHKVLHTTPPRPSELSVTAPEAFDPIVARAMARRPDERYPTAAAFSAALTAALNGTAEPPPADGDMTLVMSAARPVPATAPKPGLVTTPAPAPAGRRLSPAVLGGAGVAVLALLAGGYFVWRPADKATAPVAAVAPGAPLAAPQLQPQPQQQQAAAATPVPAPVIAPPPTPPSDTQVAALPVPPATLPSPPPPVPPPVPQPVLSPVPPPVPQPVSQPVSPPAPQPGPAPDLARPDLPAPLPASVSAPDVARPAPVPFVPSPAAPALTDIGCTLLEVSNGADGRMSVTGVAGAGTPEAASRNAAQAAAGRAPLNWGVTRFDGPYCGVADTLRAIRTDKAPATSGFDLALRGGRTRLRNGEVMAPAITAPAFPAHLQLSYFQSDQTVVHLFPYGAAQDRTLTPGTVIPVGDPRTGGWGVGEPFGTDMMVAVMSSVPLPMPPRPETEPAEAYLGALRRAGEAASRDGATIAVRTLVIRTQR